MKKLLGNIKKKSESARSHAYHLGPCQITDTRETGPDRSGSPGFVLPQGDSLEAVMVREVVSSAPVRSMASFS